MICMESRGVLDRFTHPYKNIPIECVDCNKYGAWGMYSSCNTLKQLLLRQCNSINLKIKKRRKKHRLLRQHNCVNSHYEKWRTCIYLQHT